MNKKKVYLMIIMCSMTLLLACSTSKSNNDSLIDNLVSEETTIPEEEGEVMIKNRMAITESDFIKAKGKNLYTNYGEGDLINLRGVNIGGYLFQEFWMTPTKPSKNIKAELDLYEHLMETYGESKMRELIAVYQDHYFTESDFDNLAAMGMNTVRLPFWYLNIVDSKGEVLENWYERFDWFIEEAGKRGIYVILDFHGAPGSQSGSDHSGVDGGDNKEAASEFFFGDPESVEKNQTLFYEIWTLIAERYKNNPVVAGYDLLNEPYCTYRYDSSYPVKDLHHDLWSVYDTAYKRIRAIDPDHVIIMEATWDPIDLPNPKTYNWENVMYEYHNYMYGDYDNAAGDQIKNMQKKLNLIQAADYDVPSFMGEFSYFNSYDAWDEGLDLLTQEGMNWTIWTYKTVQNYGNWGLYHHVNGGASIEILNEEKIKVIWGKVGESRPNTRLIDVVKTYLNAEMIPYK